MAIGAIEGTGLTHSAKPDLKVIEMNEAARERLDAIKALYAPFSGGEYDALRLKAIDGEHTIEQAQKDLLEHLAAKDAKAETVEAGAISIEHDAVDRYVEAASNALTFQNDLFVGPDAREQRRKSRQAMLQTDMGSFTALDLAREACRVENIPTRGMSREGVFRAAIAGRGGYYRPTLSHADITISKLTSTFTEVLGANANKALGVGYETAQETWSVWTGRKNLRNMQAHRFPILSAYGSLTDNMAENDAYTEITVTDKEELMTASKSGAKFTITLEAMINDELNAFGERARRMGQAASRAVGDRVYSVLTTNAVMNEDATALFDVATHANLITVGQAPNDASLAEMYVQMGLQTSNSQVLNLRPQYLIVPLQLEVPARKIVNASFNPTVDSGVEPSFTNVFNGSLTVVADARLSSDSAVKWYAAADPGVVDTVAVGFLDGQESPVLTEQEAFETDCIGFKVRHIFQAEALDFRGLFQNDGA